MQQLAGEAKDVVGVGPDGCGVGSACRLRALLRSPVVRLFLQEGNEDGDYNALHQSLAAPLETPVLTFEGFLQRQGYRRAAASTAAHVNWRQEEVTKGYARKARECDEAVPGDDTPFADKLASYGEEGRVLGPTVGCWCETSSDFDLLVELIAHVLADKETSMVRVAHHQAVARQRQKLVADFGVTMHIAWARHMLDNRGFVVGGGAQPGTEPVRVGGLDGSVSSLSLCFSV